MTNANFSIVLAMFLYFKISHWVCKNNTKLYMTFLAYICLLWHKMFSYVCLSPVASFQRNLTSLSSLSKVKFSTRICPFGHTQYDIIFWSFRWQFVLHIFSIWKVKRPWKKFPPQQSKSWDFFVSELKIWSVGGWGSPMARAKYCPPLKATAL